jgi:imidazolonepropionase-like amidohydrolase
MIRDTEEIDPAFVTKLRDLKLVFTPTLVRQELAWLYQQQPQWLDDPDLARTVEPDVIAAVKAWAKDRPAPSDVERREFDFARRNSRKVAASGVLIGVGSDGGSSVDFPGLMTHREIELLVESGFSPVEAITAATRNGGIALGKPEELGTLDPGRRADLLLLHANPLEDVKNLRKIERVMQDGEWVERQ